MSIRLRNSVADMQRIRRRISRRSGAALPGTGDPAVSAAVSWQYQSLGFAKYQAKYQAGT
jgi:hypothetical protein